MKRKIIHLESIDSTHLYAKRNHYEFDSDAVVIVAEEQSSGIGTNGHTWHSNAENILMSMVYKPKCKAQQLEGLTIHIAKVIKKIIFDLYSIGLEIKAPNDLMLNGKKIGGILTEISTRGEMINSLIISIGFNVNETNFPNDLRNIATSLKKETNNEFDKELIIENFINRIEDEILNTI